MDWSNALRVSRVEGLWFTNLGNSWIEDLGFRTLTDLEPGA